MDLIEVIKNLGFPIAMVVYFAWDKSTITNKLTEAVNNNTLIMEKLLTKLGIEKDVKKDE